MGRGRNRFNVGQKDKAFPFPRSSSTHPFSNVRTQAPAPMHTRAHPHTRTHTHARCTSGERVGRDHPNLNSSHLLGVPAAATLSLSLSAIPCPRSADAAPLVVSDVYSVWHGLVLQPSYIYSRPRRSLPHIYTLFIYISNRCTPLKFCPFAAFDVSNNNGNNTLHVVYVYIL